MMNEFKTSWLIFMCTIMIILNLVSGECTCDQGEEYRNKPEALKYKLGAIASILVAGVIGVCIPILGRTIKSLHPEKDIFFLIKAFAAGLILSTGFVHVLPDAFESLSSPCLSENPWGKFPFAGLGAMASSIGTLMIEVFLASWVKKSNLNDALQDKLVPNGCDVEKMGSDANNDQAAMHVHTHTTHGHSHGSTIAVVEDSNSLQLIRHRIISQVLEIGIVVHSIIIGISLGASENPKTIRPLVAALTFHQFFEGMGLGGCITQAEFKSSAVALMVIFFSLTTPIGVVIGIGISNVYNENSPTALVVEGLFNSASAGILIYMAFVDLLVPDFLSPKVQNSRYLQLGVNIALVLGAGCMSVLAIWA